MHEPARGGHEDDGDGSPAGGCMFDDGLGYMAMSVMNTFIAPIISVAVATPVVIYILARWRTYRDGGPPDPQVGIKVALSWFRIASYQMLLFGSFLLLYDVIGDLGERGKEEVMRMAGGILFPGGIIYAAHHIAIGFTNARERPQVVRMFAGLSLIQTGLVGFTALVLVGVFLFQKHTPKEPNRMAWSLVLVYVPAWCAQGVMLAREVFGRNLPTAVARYDQPPMPPPPGPAPQ
jgi:hypothetical protein